MEAIHLTSPRFDLEELSKCLYYRDEVAIISKIAITYTCCGQRWKTIDILGQLLTLVLKRTPDHSYLPLLANNYALQLALENRLEDALEISRLGRQACVKKGHYHLLPKFLHIEAECYYLAGDLNTSLELFRSAYYIYGAVMDTRNQEYLKTDAEERFQLVF